MAATHAWPRSPGARSAPSTSCAPAARAQPRAHGRSGLGARRLVWPPRAPALLQDEAAAFVDQSVAVVVPLIADLVLGVLAVEARLIDLLIAVVAHAVADLGVGDAANIA